MTNNPPIKSKRIIKFGMSSISPNLKGGCDFESNSLPNRPNVLIVGLKGSSEAIMKYKPKMSEGMNIHHPNFL
jgi:hypothetical protein